MPCFHRPAPRRVARVALVSAAAFVALAATGVRDVLPRDAGVRTAGSRTTPPQRGVVAYVIPQQQPDQAALKTLLGVLSDHGVEIRRALAPFASGRVRYSAGAYIILASQPAAPAAAALLAPANGDVVRNASTVDTLPPRGDTVALGLPSLLGVGVAEVRDSFPVPVTMPSAPGAPRYVTPAGLGDSVRRVVGVFVPPNAGRPVAWTRATLVRFGVAFAPLDGSALSAGDVLRGRYDVVLLPDAGFAPYSTVSGSGVRAFLDAGGTIVAVGSGAQWAERSLRLPGRFGDIPPSENRRPGDVDSALVLLKVDRRSPIAADMVAHAVAWVAGGPTTVFVPDTTYSRVVAAYDVFGDVIRPGEQVRHAYDGAAAVVDVPQGHGRVILFSFDPAYRGVSLATLPLLWGALRHSDP
jgi:hypothetical protein